MSGNNEIKQHGGDVIDKLLAVAMTASLLENNSLQQENNDITEAEAKAAKKHRAKIELLIKQMAMLEAERLGLAKDQADRKKQVDSEQDKVFNLGMDLKNCLKEKDVAQKFFALCSIQEKLLAVDNALIEDIAYKDKFADSLELCRDELEKIKAGMSDEAFDSLKKISGAKQKLSEIIAAVTVFADSDIELLKSECLQIRTEERWLSPISVCVPEVSAAERIIADFERNRANLRDVVQFCREKQLYLPDVTRIIAKVFEARGIRLSAVNSIPDGSGNNSTFKELPEITDEFAQLAVASCASGNNIQNAFDELAKHSGKESFSIAAEIAQNRLSQIPHFVCSKEFPQVLKRKADRIIFGYCKKSNSYIIFLANAVVYIDTELEFYSSCSYSEIQSGLPPSVCNTICEAAEFMRDLDMAGEPYDTPEEFKTFEENLKYFMKVVIPVFNVCKKYSAPRALPGFKVQMRADEQSLVSADSIATFQISGVRLDLSRKGFAWSWALKKGFFSWKEFLQSPDCLARRGMFSKVTWRGNTIICSRHIFELLTEICDKCNYNAVAAKPLVLKTNTVFKIIAFIVLGIIFCFFALAVTGAIVSNYHKNNRQTYMKKQELKIFANGNSRQRGIHQQENLK